MSDELKKLGIAFQDPMLVEKYYQNLKGIFISGLSNPDIQGMFLDLNSLPAAPYNFKEIVIKWLVYVNLPRILKGQDPIISLGLVLQCPIWKVIKPPIQKITLTKEAMFGKPSILASGKKQKAGSINKK